MSLVYKVGTKGRFICYCLYRKICSDWRYVITACKRSLVHCNVFTPVCQSFCSRGTGEQNESPLDADPSLDVDPPRRYMGILWYTVNKRAVRILLECILVLYFSVTDWLLTSVVLTQEGFTSSFIDATPASMSSRWQVVLSSSNITWESFSSWWMIHSESAVEPAVMVLKVFDVPCFR